MDKHFETLDKKQGSLDHQDWTPQVVRKKKDNVTDGGSKKKISQAQQRDNKLMKKADNDDLKHDL